MRISQRTLKTLPESRKFAWISWLKFCRFSANESDSLILDISELSERVRSDPFTILSRLLHLSKFGETAYTHPALPSLNSLERTGAKVTDAGRRGINAFTRRLHRNAGQAP